MENKNKKQASVSPHLQYRVDINGIRAIAILLVVISHGWWHILPSGKVGVDVFFVISGYLISGIIFRERSKGVHTIWQFYSRRIKRLAPALIFFLGYMLFLIPNSYFRNDRARMRQEGSHIIASILMAENLEHIRMDFNNQYNSTVTTHLWSLGIQQQFYIFWPLVTGLIMKLNLKWGSLTFLVMIGLSLYFQFYLEDAYNGWRTSRYVPFAKFWELLVGCLLAFVQFKMKQAEIQKNQSYYQVILQKDQVLQLKQMSSNEQAAEYHSDKNQANNLEKRLGQESMIKDNQLIDNQQTRNRTLNNGIKCIKELFTLKGLRTVLIQIIPFVCMYVIIASAAFRVQLQFINNRQIQHAGFRYVKPVLATLVLLMTKDSFFNRRILGFKVLQFIGDISYPLYLWHAGLEMAYQNTHNILVQIYVPALMFAFFSMKFIEPFFRRNEGKWVIPFLIVAQILILWRAYQLYSAHL